MNQGQMRKFTAATRGVIEWSIDLRGGEFAGGVLDEDVFPELLLGAEYALVANNATSRTAMMVRILMN